jgi:uncharacterized SAM-binding protein YcdF (DUF218 family)
MFGLKYLIKPFILPPMLSLILLAVAGIFWRRRWARVLFWIVFVMLIALHSPYVAMKLRHPLESSYEPLVDPAHVEPYDGIVVLMAGTIPAGGLVPFSTVSEPLFHRLDEAWRLYRLHPKPIIVSGGHVNPFTQPQNENQIACDYLILWGIPKDQVISEPRSRDTFENAIEAGKIIRERGWKRYLLVTSAIHMPRSMLVFRAIAPEPIAAPGDFTYAGGGVLVAEEAAVKIAAAVHEYLGIVNYRWRLRSYRSEER